MSKKIWKNIRTEQHGELKFKKHCELGKTDKALQISNLICKIRRLNEVVCGFLGYKACCLWESKASLCHPSQRTLKKDMVYHQGKYGIHKDPQISQQGCRVYRRRKKTINRTAWGQLFSPFGSFSAFSFVCFSSPSSSHQCNWFGRTGSRGGLPLRGLFGMDLGRRNNKAQVSFIPDFIPSYLHLSLKLKYPWYFTHGSAH